MPHLNGIQLAAGSGPLMTISHNTILCDYSQTDAIMLANDAGAQTNRTITNNLLGAAATPSTGPGAQRQATNIGSRQQVLHGPLSRQRLLGSGRLLEERIGNVWSNNTWADGPTAGQLVST